MEIQKEKLNLYGPTSRFFIIPDPVDFVSECASKMIDFFMNSFYYVK